MQNESLEHALNILREFRLASVAHLEELCRYPCLVASQCRRLRAEENPIRLIKNHRDMLVVQEGQQHLKSILVRRERHSTVGKLSKSFGQRPMFSFHRLNLFTEFCILKFVELANIASRRTSTVAPFQARLRTVLRVWSGMVSRNRLRMATRA